VTDPDRRRYRRAKAPILIRPIGPLAQTQSRQVGDISLGGLRAFSDEKHKPGRRLELELFLPDGGSVTVVAEVVWVQALPAGSPARFDVGLRYVDVDPKDLQRIAQVLGDE
jgi:c-di-GMP-binding flagellar brake protein YcgR